MTFLGPFFQERQDLWLSKDDLKDPSSWSSSPLLLLRDIHSKFLSDYNRKETSSQSQVNVVSGIVVDSTPRTVSLILRILIPSHSLNSTVVLSLPLCKMRTLSPTMLLLPSPHIIGSPNRYSTTGIPSWLLDLKLMFPDSCHTEQLSLCSQQHIVTTVEDSVLRTEMDD